MAVGARTGRDGIHGATFASEELSEDSDEASRPQVQVGDPFTEKLLLEASLELIKSGHIVGIQDMGAAGLTSSASEMAGRGGSGVVLDTALVPVREPGMTPYEILLSESQERMLVVAERGHEDEVTEILEKWELEAAVVGHVTDDGRFRIVEDGHTVADIPALPLTTGCPTYEREGIESEEIRALRTEDLSDVLALNGDLTPTFMKLVASPNIASKRWVYEQYDSTVRSSTVARPGGDAGVIRIRETRKAVAATTDCNGRYVYLSPRRGAQAAMAEAARNLVCVGAVPLAITNNLNFGNPLKADIYYQFREAVLGMAEACKAFETPVTNTREVGASELVYVLRGKVAGEPPTVDLMAERSLQNAVLALIQEDLLHSAHDCSEGGLACALAESAIGNGENPLGIDVRLEDELPPAAVLFGEAQGRVVVSCASERVDAVRRIAERHGVPCQAIGTVGTRGGIFRIRALDSGVEVDLDTLTASYFGALPDIMNRATGN
jgi:phosphoribosylformylglycinamidine synthase